MPLALSTATLALNSPLQMNYQAPPQNHAQQPTGLIAQQIGHSLSLNDSLSTINQSLSNLNNLLPTS